MYPLIEQYLSSGSSQSHFCAAHDLKLCTFQYWLGKYRREQSPPAERSAGFVALALEPGREPDFTPALSLDHASGHHLRFGVLPPLDYLKGLLC